MIDSRARARQDRNLEQERALNPQIKKSVKKDRDIWLTGMLQTGEWDQIKALRRGTKHKQGRLKDIRGQLVSSEDRAETLAEYLEKVQWTVRPLEPPLSDELLGPELPVSRLDISEEEVVEAASQLKIGKASGNDHIPPELWKQICVKGTKACQWAVELCQKCWSQGSVPEKWDEARVAMIFKKGDVADCGNYRPISLLQIGYKIFALVLLRRLKAAGAETRIWHTQFGFCSQRGTLDAVFLARRIIEEANAQQDKRLVLLALDWAKAFDSISPEALCHSLWRFGLPDGVLRCVKAI